MVKADLFPILDEFSRAGLSTCILSKTAIMDRIRTKRQQKDIDLEDESFDPILICKIKRTPTTGGGSVHVLDSLLQAPK